MEKKLCPRCFKLPAGSHRKEIDNSDCGFGERLLVLGLLLVLVYLASGLLIKIINYLLSLLNA